MRRMAALAGVATVGFLMAACSSSGTTTGTETLTGSLTGVAAANLLNSNSNTIALRLQKLQFTGPVTTSVTNVSLGGGNKTASTHTFVTPAGNLTVMRAQTTQAQQQPTFTGRVGNICYFKFNGGGGTYTVDGSQSTSQFSGATGHGTYSVSFRGGVTLNPGSTTCNANDTGNVVAKGASLNFNASGPLTVKS